MNLFHTTDYSNLFTAGLRVIESRRKGRRSSSSSHLSPSILSSSSTSSSSTPDHEGKACMVSAHGNKVSSSWKTFHFPTRLWPHSSPSPRNEKSLAADTNSNHNSDDDNNDDNDAKSKLPTHQRSLSGSVVEEASLDVRIWDWSTHVYNATSTLSEEEDERVDPYLHKVDRKATIIVTLPTPAYMKEQQDDIPSPPRPLPTPSRSSETHHNQREQQRRVSLQTMLPAHHHPHRSVLEGGVWESASSSDDDEDEDGSGLDDDWHQFRVEWIDFNAAH